MNIPVQKHCSNSRRRGWLKSAAAIALFCAAPFDVLAQPIPALPGAVQPGRDRPAPQVPIQPDFDFSIEAPSRSPVARAVDEVRFTLKDIEVSGARTVSPESLRPLYQSLLGKEVRLNDILDVADQIEQTYRNFGYILVRAYVPPQRVRDGVFTINVVEGKIANVSVEGGTPATQEKIMAYLRPSLDVAPLPLDTMERSLLLSNDMPGVGNATGVLRPAADIPGASDIVVTVDQPRMQGGFGVDNRGSRFSGLWTLNADLQFNSIFGADQLGAMLTTSPDATEQIVGQLRYRRAIGSNGLIGSLFGTITHGQPGSTLSAFGVVTDSWAVGPRLSWPVLRTRSQSLQLDAGFTAQEAKIEILGSRIGHDAWRVFDISATYLAGNWLGGSWLAAGGVAQGLPGLGATANGAAQLSRRGGYTDFTKLTGQLRYLAMLPRGFSLQLTGQGQFASAPLINGELISFGGIGIGRGYDPGGIVGDHGLGGSAELRYDAPFANTFLLALQPYAYIDGGHTWYIQRGAALDPALVDQSITSVGGGLRMRLPYETTLGLEVAHTLNAVTGSDAGSRATKFFVTVGKRF